MTPKEQAAMQPSQQAVAAMQQALEALKNAPIEYDFHGNPMDVEFGQQLDKAITALREALDPELQFVRDWNEGKVRRVSDGKVMGFAEQAEQEPYAPYGFCPICGRRGISRERRIDGNDTCVTGHRYASSEAIPPELIEPVKQEPVACYPCEIVTADFGENTVTVEMMVDHYQVSAGTKYLCDAAPVRTKDLSNYEIASAIGCSAGDIAKIGDARAVIAADREKNK